MPHGDFSDLAAVALIAGGVQQVFYPAYNFEGFGMIKPFFDSGTSSPELIMMISKSTLLIT